jgi:2-polyprenyl-3-methyl-5-hydroxy-6-metoxy-1,4-benzoquinol methylase
MTEPRPSTITPEQAVREVERRFPIADYFEEPILPFLNIATTVRKYLPAGAKLLDFGAGAGDKASVLQMLGYRCTAYDDLDDGWHNRYGNRERILAFAREIGIEFHAGEMPKFPPGEFDMVMLFHVLEHFQDSPRDLLNDLLEATKPEGLLFVKMPNLGNIRKRLDVLRGKSNLESYGRYFWTPGRWRGHVREYVKDDLRQLAAYLNLDILELRGVHDMLCRIPRKLRPIYRAATALLPNWRDSWMMVAKKRAGWKPVRAVPQKLAHLIGGRDWVPKERATETQSHREEK